MGMISCQVQLSHFWKYETPLLTVTIHSNFLFRLKLFSKNLATAIDIVFSQDGEAANPEMNQKEGKIYF